jgi:CRP-like cAMP-binding protein
VIVTSVALRTLKLGGHTLRQALEASPAVSEGVIRLLVQRLQRIGAGTSQTPGHPTGA